MLKTLTSPGQSMKRMGDRRPGAPGLLCSLLLLIAAWSPAMAQEGRTTVPLTSLTLIKHVINDDGGTLGVSDFPLFVDGQQVDSGVATELAPGTCKPPPSWPATGMPRSWSRS